MKISVALPVYNGANYLREALESAVAQGPELAEIVVSDNCSTDNTPAIVAEFARRDPRVRLERAEVFLNQADNISRAVRLCQNEWVQMLCHDDLLRPGAIAALVKVVEAVTGTDCALIGHRSCHLFADGHVHRQVGGVSKVAGRADLMTTSVADGPTDYRLHPADIYLGEVMRRGTMPSLPAVTTAAVRRSVFEEMGGFDPRWVHFDVFLWTHLIQSYGYAESADHWTLTRVHAQQVAVLSRKNQRSYRDFAAFFADFLPQARASYGLSNWAYLKLNLKPFSQAASPLVVALFLRRPREFISQWLALPCWSWPLVLALTGLNYFRERRRNAKLWSTVAVELTYE